MKKTPCILALNMLTAIAAIILMSLGRDPNRVILLMLVITIVSIFCIAVLSRDNIRFPVGLQSANALLFLIALFMDLELQNVIIGLAVFLAIEIVFLLVWIIWHDRCVKQDIIDEYSLCQPSSSANEDDERNEES